MMSVVAGIVVVTLAFTISMYNKLVMRRNQVSSVEASVDVQLKRRYDLLPNLVATAKEYMSHERSLLERIVTLRESAKLAHTTSEKFQLNNEISGVLRHLQVRLEITLISNLIKIFCKFRPHLVMWKSKFLQRDVLIIQQLKSITMRWKCSRQI